MEFAFLCIAPVLICTALLLTELNAFESVVPSGRLGAILPSGEIQSSTLTLANFGRHPFGRVVIGNGYYLDKNQSSECRNSSQRDTILETKGSIFLIDGVIDELSLLIDKIKCAQALEAIAAIVIENETSDTLKLTKRKGLVKSRFSNDIVIPVVMIGHSFGKDLSHLLSSSDRPIIPLALDLRQVIPPQEKASFELQMRSYCLPDIDCKTQEAFFQEMADFIEELVVRNLVEFSVHYVIWRCPPGQERTISCQSQCIFQGRYCAPQPDITPGSRVTGQDIIKETTRELCLFKLLQETGLVSIWWEYIARFLLQCNQKMGKERSQCSSKVFSQVGADKVLNGNKRWESCIKRHKFNQQGIHSVLEKEVEMQLQSNWSSPGEIRINGLSYLGNVVSSSVKMAICSGLIHNEVEICKPFSPETGTLDPIRKLESTGVKENSNLTSSTYPVSPTTYLTEKDDLILSWAKSHNLQSLPLEEILAVVICVLVLLTVSAYLGIKRLDAMEGSGCNYDATADLKLTSNQQQNDSEAQSSSNIPFRHCRRLS